MSLFSCSGLYIRFLGQGRRHLGEGNRGEQGKEKERDGRRGRGSGKGRRADGNSFVIQTGDAGGGDYPHFVLDRKEEEEHLWLMPGRSSAFRLLSCSCFLLPSPFFLLPSASFVSASLFIPPFLLLLLFLLPPPPSFVKKSQLTSDRFRFLLMARTRCRILYPSPRSSPRRRGIDGLGSGSEWEWECCDEQLGGERSKVGLEGGTYGRGSAGQSFV